MLKQCLVSVPQEGSKKVKWVYNVAIDAVLIEVRESSRASPSLIRISLACKRTYQSSATRSRAFLSPYSRPRRIMSQPSRQATNHDGTGQAGGKSNILAHRQRPPTVTSPTAPLQKNRPGGRTGDSARSPASGSPADRIFLEAQMSYEKARARLEEAMQKWWKDNYAAGGLQQPKPVGARDGKTSNHKNQKVSEVRNAPMPKQVNSGRGMGKPMTGQAGGR